MTPARVTIALSAILLLLFGTMFYIQYRLFSATDPTFHQQLEQVETSVKHEDWVKALAEVKQIEKTWNKGQILVAIKYSDTSYTLLNLTLKELKGAIITRDKHEAVRSAKESLFLFENITSVSPRST